MMYRYDKKINYSQCWEDPLVLIKALKINQIDNIISITSGGDNTIALSLENPRSIIAIDANPAQNYLLELKLVAIKNLSYEDFLEFLGVSDSKRRIEIFLALKEHLSSGAREWWEDRPSLIKDGIINAGKFEKYLTFFRKKILPLIHSKKMVSKLLSLKTLVDQKKFYNEQWNTFKWRLVFRLFFNKTILNWFGRAPHSFIHTETKDIALHYLKRVKYALTEIPISNNHFLDFILTGTYSKQNDLPPYLKLENFNRLKSTVGKIKIINGTIQEFLITQSNNSFSKFNLSDIFETISEHEKDSLFQELVRIADNDSIVVYWNNLVERSHPTSLNRHIFNDTETATILYRNDRAFFYSKLIIENIKKENA